MCSLRAANDVAAREGTEANELARQSTKTQSAQLARHPKRAAVRGKSARIVYKGDAVLDVAMPVGGIGAGSIALCGTGELREWQIFNQVNSACDVPHSFFAIWAKRPRREPVARLLQSRPVGEMPGVRSAEFVGECPIGHLDYRDRALPVRVSLEAYTPLIPMRARDSAVPAVVFTFTITNRTDERVRVSLAASMQNAVGFDGLGEIDGVANPGYGKNRNRVVRRPRLTAVHMTSDGPGKRHRNFGSMTLATTQRTASALAQWDDPHRFWHDFAADGRFARSHGTGPSAKGRTWNAALAVRFSLGPGQQRQLTFVLAWHFPNRHADYSAELAKHRLGNMYNNWFADSMAVAQHVIGNLRRLTADTYRFRDTFYDSTLPYWLLDCVSSQISTLCSEVCMWIEDGSFHAFEGAGCCPMNCTHVWNYEQTMGHLYPELERNMRHTDLVVQQDPSGFVHHRTVLPLSLPRASGPFIDGHLSTVSKAYREHLRSKDRRWLRLYWPNIKRAMDWAMTEYDPDSDGVIDGTQWNTYDCAIYGPNTFIGSQWLAALRAAEDMAKIMRDGDAAVRYRRRFEKGRTALDRLVWNGEYWIQKYDPRKYTETQYGKGCHSDQVLGQWWAHVLNLGYVLPKARVSKALKSIFKYNWRDDFSNFKHNQRVFAAGDDMGLLCCTWPRRGRPKKPILYCDEVWTGIEYQVAAHMIWEGMLDPALQIVKAARERYNGVPRPPFRRNPWNEIECGEHYTRAMSSWSLLLAASGFHYDGPAALVRFDPQITPERFRAFFSGAEGWGTFSQTRDRWRQANTLRVAHGRLALRRLVVGVPAGRKVKKVSVRGAGAPVDLAHGDGELTIIFGRRVVLRAGDALRIAITW